MGFRQVYIKTAGKLSLEDNSLVVWKDLEKHIKLPLEDIDLIFVEDPNCIITSRLITEASNFGVAIIFCDSNYLPSTISIPFNKHYLQSEILKLQLDLLPSKKNKLWETIVKSKINNQINVLLMIGVAEENLTCMRHYYDCVKFGDEHNMEGAAAREYFKILFGENFVRFGQSSISHALNYGYSIINGAIIRTIACSGLTGNIGIWHDSKQNSNNLASDLIEPFRQIVDLYVYKNINRLSMPLDMDVRKDLIGILNEIVEIDGKKYKINYAITLLVDSFIAYLRTGDIAVIKMPSIVESVHSSEDQDESDVL